MSRSFQRSNVSELTNLEMIGSGGFCVIFKADHPNWGTVAYRKLQVNSIKEPDASRLVAEATIHGWLDHENIVKMFGFIFEPENYGLILEFTPNGDLAEYLHTTKESLGQCVDWGTKMRFLRGIVSGMKYLHNQNPPVIHGDLKIGNVLVSDNLTAKVCDFGFAQWKKFSESHSVNDVRTGTVTHVPPEYWNDSRLRKVEAFDVYGFGILIWEVATEEKPYLNGCSSRIREWVVMGQRPDIDDLPANCPSETKHLMEVCWHGDPKERPTFTDIERLLGPNEGNARNRDSSQHSPIGVPNHQSRQTLFPNAIQLTETGCNRNESGVHNAEHGIHDRTHLFRKFAIDGEDYGVVGVAWIENSIYVICLESPTIHVYDESSEPSSIEIRKMKFPRDMAAITASRSIFVSDKSCLWKVQLPYNEISRWDMDGEPTGLSVTPSDDLLVLVVKTDGGVCIDIYNPSRVRRRSSIPLPSTIKTSNHAVQLESRNFIISYSTKKVPKEFLISELSKDGKSFLATFDFRSFEPNPAKKFYPSHLSIDVTGSIFVANCSSLGGNKVVLLNRQLNKYELILDKYQHHIVDPTRLLYLPEKQQMIVGQGWGARSPPSVSIVNICMYWCS